LLDLAPLNLFLVFDVSFRGSSIGVGFAPPALFPHFEKMRRTIEPGPTSPARVLAPGGEGCKESNAIS
jgi:hypothetical protein